jgi:hypothetical protein
MFTKVNLKLGKLKDSHEPRSEINPAKAKQKLATSTSNSPLTLCARLSYSASTSAVRALFSNTWQRKQESESEEGIVAKAVN